jgi:hypothetical protein
VASRSSSSGRRSSTRRADIGPRRRLRKEPAHRSHEDRRRERDDRDDERLLAERGPTDEPPTGVMPASHSTPRPSAARCDQAQARSEQPPPRGDLFEKLSDGCYVWHLLYRGDF